MSDKIKKTEKVTSQVNEVSNPNLRVMQSKDLNTVRNSAKISKVVGTVIVYAFLIFIASERNSSSVGGISTNCVLIDVIIIFSNNSTFEFIMRLSRFLFVQ